MAHLDTMAADLERGLAFVLVDVDRWPTDPEAWQRDLAKHNQARLLGWKLIRVPSLWMGTSQADAVIDGVRGMNA